MWKLACPRAQLYASFHSCIVIEPPNLLLQVPKITFVSVTQPEFFPYATAFTTNVRAQTIFNK